MGMARFDRLIGMTRSLIVYHAIPFRQRSLRRLYRTFLAPGDLAFDVGAHVGNRTRGLAALGCRVVSVEPQPEMARMLRRLVGHLPGVMVVESAVANRPGVQTLWVGDRHPTLATIAQSWKDARGHDERFASVRWHRSIEVQTTTLDDLIARYGVPAFVKIDVEGSELAVLQGLSQPVRTVSIEYLPGALDDTAACVSRLEEIGHYEFNWSPGETFRLMAARWQSAPELLDALRGAAAQRQSGDVYARCIDRAGITAVSPRASA
jgi:FkbM family methyltransferase